MVLLFFNLGRAVESGRGQTLATQPADRGAFADEDLASSPTQRMSPETGECCARSMPKSCRRTALLCFVELARSWREDAAHFTELSEVNVSDVRSICRVNRMQCSSGVVRGKQFLRGNVTQKNKDRSKKRSLISE